jgi:2-iminobutanoate/2-iminopropanoate deaminase
MTMDNVGLVLREAGLDYGNLVSCHVQLTDMEDFAAMNKVYGGYCEAGRYPARTTLEMPGLVGEARLEITCVAYTDRQQIQTVMPPEGSIPPAIGPYSPAVWAGDTLYLSGQGGLDPKTKKVAEPVEAQTAQTLANIAQILQAAGLSPRDAALVNSYYLGPENFGKIDTVLRPFFEPGAAPARGNFCLSRLPAGISAEITFIARRGEHRRITAGGDQGDAAAVLAGDTLYLSAQSAPEAGANFEAQFRGLMEKLRQPLQEAGMEFRHAVNAHVYLKDVSQFEEMNKLFVEFFPQNPPARTTVQVREEGDREPVLVEVALVAVR